MKVGYKDLGTMPYKECWQLQQSLFESRLEQRRTGLEAEDCGTILTVEHTPVYTLGKSGKQSNMLIPQSYLESLGAEFFHIDRGGDITFHGPGQIVCYPILDIEKLGIGLRRYIEILEEAVITTVAHYGILLSVLRALRAYGFVTAQRMARLKIGERFAPSVSRRRTLLLCTALRLTSRQT